MADPYFGVRYIVTNLAMGILASLGMTVNDAINAVRNCNIQAPARKADQRWCYGPALNGTEIQVLVQETTSPGIVRIVTVRH